MQSPSTRRIANPTPSLSMGRRTRPIYSVIVAMCVVGSTAAMVLSLPTELGAHPGPTTGTGASDPTFHSALGYSGPGGLQCDGMYYYGNPTDYYAPTYCYGHDEPTISYISNGPHSGEDARFSFVLPRSGPVYDQGQLYATFWLGGVVTDVNSTGGSGTGFLELQFYPASPVYQGAGSGSKDCLPNGAFDPNQSAASLASNVWFSCAIVWQLGGPAGNTESAAIAAPMDIVGSSDAILTMNGGDRMNVAFSGVARSPTQGWNLTISDLSSGLTSSRSLVNGTLVLSPYYATAAASNTLSWGASGPGAIAFAYEIGHTLDPSQTVNNASGECLPGDGACLSYWPGKWSQSGQMQLGLPVMGAGPGAGFPPQIGLSSSQGGAAEINDSSCLMPSFSPLRNCMYPFFVYRAANYSFTFDADYGSGVVANATNTYDNEYQFPGQTGGSTPVVGFAQSKRLWAAPWGTLNALVVPANASVQFNAVGSNTSVAVGANGSAYGQFMEGEYWLNVSLPGCPNYSQPVYLKTGATFSPTVDLYCPYLTVGARASPSTATAGSVIYFTSIVSGGSSPYSFSWDFGDGTTSTAINPAHSYAAPGNYTAHLTVTSSGGQTASAVTSIVVTPRWALSPTADAVKLYATDVQTSGNSVPSVFPMSTAFPVGQADINTGYLFPGPVSPTTWTFSLNQSTAGTLYFAPGSPATAHFFLSFESGGLAGPGAVPVTVVADLTANGHSIGTGTETQNLSLGGSVSEYNISFDPEVASLGAPDTLAVSFTWYSAAATGESISAGLAFHSGAQYPIGIDLPLLDPALLSAPSAATNASTVLVSETALSPFGSYDLAGVSGFVDGAPVALTGASGSSYSWAIPTSSLAPGTHTFTGLAEDLQGFSVSSSTTFTIGTKYPVSFAESGLPAGTSWSVSVAGATLKGSGITLSTMLTNGSYTFTVTPVPGYVASPSAGSLTVTGGAVSVPIVFSPATYSVVFSENGLAKGKVWSATLGGVTRSLKVADTGSSSITFVEPNGTYGFVVSAKGYLATPASGNVSVQGAAVSVSVVLTKGPT